MFSQKAKNKILFGPILLAVNHRFNIKLHEEREKEILGNVFEILPDFWLNMYVMGLHITSN